MTALLLMLAIAVGVYGLVSDAARGGFNGDQPDPPTHGM
jgi:hypothetical protein